MAAAGGRLAQAMTLFARLCEPLGFIHGQGIVHCDLKPGNIFIRGDGRPVLVDFGLLSRAGGAVGRETLEIGGRLKGTLPYMAPELIRGEIPDARADLYALGCILYEILTGRPPFVAATALGFLEAHLRAEHEPASRWVTGIPSKLDALLASLLAKDPAQRIGSAETVAAILGAILEALGSVAPVTPRGTPYLFRPRVVGREATIEQLSTYRAAAERGNGCMILVNGESGIGKTFLASELAQRVARSGFEVVTGECIPVAATQIATKEVVAAALQPFRSLIQAAADHCRDASREALLGLFGSARSVALLARFEPSLANLVDPAAVESIAPLPPSAERERVLEALFDLLARVTRDRPLLLIIDDLQWADDLSMAFMNYVADNGLTGRRLMLVGLYRREEASSSISELEQKPSVHTIRLDRLDSSALRVLVSDLLSDQPPEAFIQALAVHSEGNPFFVAEYLRAGASEGLLQRTAEGWRLAKSDNAHDYASFTLPPSLHALLERRLATLAPTTQRMAEAASVMGREFSVSMLLALTGVLPGTMTSSVDEMLVRQVVERSSEDRLRFLHDKLREAAYDRIVDGRQISLHAMAADLIEKTYLNTPELPAHYSELAYHLRKAGQSARAVDYFEKAGEYALRASADADAVRCLCEARDLVRKGAHASPSRQASWERMTGDALYGLGDLETAIQHLNEAVELLDAPMPKRRSHFARSVVSELGRQVLHRLLPGRRKTADPMAGASLLEAARAYARLEQIHYYRGEYLPLMVATLASLNLSERAGPSSHLATAYANAGAAAGILPLRRIAARYFALAESTLQQAYDMEAESYVRLGHSVYLAGLGEWRQASASCERGQELASRLGFHRRWEEITAVRAMATNDLQERMELAGRTIESASRRSDAQTAAWGLLNHADLFAIRGEVKRASECVSKVEAMLSRVGDPERTAALAIRSHLHLTTGAVEEAAATADKAARLVALTRPIHYGNTTFGRSTNLPTFLGSRVATSIRWVVTARWTAS